MYDGDASFVKARAINGEIGILDNHAPMIAILENSPVVVHTSQGERKFYVERGVCIVENNTVKIIVSPDARGSASTS